MFHRIVRRPWPWGPSTLFLVCLLGASCRLGFPARPVWGQESVPAPGRLASAPLDSLASTSADSLAPAAPDSLASARADSLAPAPSDSLALAPADRAASGDAEAAAEPPLILDPRALPPWVEGADLDAAALAERRGQVLADAVESLPGAWSRVAGDRGAPAFVGLSPVGVRAPELLVDGIPSRSPSDLDPGLWDRSLVGIVALDVVGGAIDVPGPALLRTQSDPAQPGRVVLRTHFNESPNESFLRAFSVTTPHAPRTLRLDFEEWITNDGDNFIDSFANLSDFGRSKMRRFRLLGEVGTRAGRASFLFGRGTRLIRGTVESPILGVRQSERWTGEVAVGLDRDESDAYWQFRGYHLDWHDHDFNVDEIRDATRLGLRVTRSPRGSGWSLAAVAERWSARFEGAPTLGQEILRPAPAYHARLRGGYAHHGARFRPRGALEVLYATHTGRRVDAGGVVGLEADVSGGVSLVGEARRDLRVPTLLETHGFQTRALESSGSVFRATRLAGGNLRPERQDRLHGGSRLTWGRLTLDVGWERWRLREGSGWLPTTTAGIDVAAPTLGGLELDVDQWVAGGELELGTWRTGARIRAHGHSVIGTLENAADRGAGWPRRAVAVQVHGWRRLFGDRDFLGFVYRYRHLGERFDDFLAPYDVVVPAVDRHDLRAYLKLRDAELYAELFNLTDVLQTEVTGTRRRGRELILGISWPFFD